MNKIKDKIRSEALKLAYKEGRRNIIKSFKHVTKHSEEAKEKMRLAKLGTKQSKRGQTLGLSILSGIVVLIVGLLVINFLMDEVTNFRVNMDCASPSDFSDGTILLCLATDTSVPYWILLMFSILVGAIVARLAI